MVSNSPAIPRSLNLTIVCYKISQMCLDLFSCRKVGMIVKDEYGWRMYELLKDGKFRKTRVKDDPTKYIQKHFSQRKVVELKASGAVAGWIVLEETSNKPEDETLFQKLAEELPEWLNQIRRYRQARRQAVKDGLTDLFNYRYFIDALQKEIKTVTKFLSLIVIDVDDFKKYNDYFGHLKGSALLREIGGILRRSCSSGNLVAKYGGDEFAVILRGTPKEEAFLIAQSIRYRIERHKFPGEEKSQPNRTLTVSGGIATYPVDAEEAFRLFDQADHAMYDAKLKGKNRVMYLD